LFAERKIVVDWAVPRLPKGDNNANVSLKVKDKPEEHVAIKREKSECVEESSHVGKKLKVSVTETKKCKKIRNSKKGRLIIRNLPFKASKAVNLYF
jgi:hypothetical protein